MEFERSGRRPVRKRNSRKKKLYPFRWAAFILLIVAGYLCIEVPGMSAEREREAEEVETASDAYWMAQNENNRLSSLVAESSTKDFVERVARRDYGYCVYGETIYTVSNLDEILAAEEEDGTAAESQEETAADPDSSQNS